MPQVVTSSSVLGSSIETAEIANGAVTETKLGVTTLLKVEQQTGAGNLAFTGLDINTDGFYFFVAKIKAASTDGKIKLFINGDTTDANYYSQSHEVNSAAIGSVRDNDARCARLSSDSTVFHGYVFRNTAGYACVIITGMWETTLQTFTYNLIKKDGVVANITSLSFNPDQTTDAGSTITIYKAGV